MIIRGDKIYLRDMVASDLADYERWLTVETEWQKWDAPWQPWTVKEIESYLDWRRQLLTRPLRPVRARFEICTALGTHIGWVTCYPLDGDHTRPTVGIDIPPTQYRGQGLGREAFTLFTHYIAHNYPQMRIYCQTWSGNTAMMSLAESVGFVLFLRERNFWEKGGVEYDLLTYQLTETSFAAFSY